jgi:hypothetical protein
MVLLLAGCQRQLPPTPTPAPDLGLHLLVETKGDFHHKRPGWVEYLPLSFGTRLDRDDLLRAAPNAEGLIVCADLSLTHVSPDYHSGLPCPRATPVLIRDGSPVLGPRRDKPLDHLIPYILSPRHTFIHTPYPLLRWHPSGTGTVTYTVRVWGGTLDWQVETTVTELLYPDDAPPLEPGVPYHLTVVDDNGRSSAEEQTALDLSLALLPPEKVAAVKALVTQAQELGLAERATLLLETEIYAAHGLRADAIALLEKLGVREDAPAIPRRLGDLYLEVGLYVEARGAYEQALIGYRALGDKAGEAHALVGLGLAYRGNDDDVTARKHLEQALSIYQAIGDTEGTKWVEDVLAKMGG